MKKRKIAARLLAFGLTLALAGGVLTGCSKTKSSSSYAVMDKEHVYKAEYFDMPEGMENVNRMKVFNDRIYLDGYLKEIGFRYQIISINIDGTDKKILYEQKENDNGSINSFAVDMEGNICFLKNSYEEDASDPDNVQYKNTYSIVKLDPEGKELLNKEIKDIKNDFYANDFLVDKEGNMYMFSYDRLFIVDKEGKTLADVDTSTGNIDGLFLTKDGKVMASSYNQDYTKREIKEFLIDQKKFSEPKTMEGGTFNYNFYGGCAGYDLLLKDSTDLYGYNLETNEKTKLLNWIDSDMNGTYINTIIGMEDGRILCLSNNWMKRTSELAVLSKVKPEDVVEKEIMTLATVYLDQYVNAAIIEFNKKNEKYRITVKDYSTYSTAEDYMAGSKKLNTDIISGDVPDILCVTDASAFESFSAKGLFADFNEIMKKDESFHKSDYLENVFTAFEKGGKLYSVAPYINLFTVVGKTSDVGEEMGWTIDDLNALVASKPEGTKIFRDMSRDTILAYGGYLSMDDYIDWENNKANFDNPEFIKLLEFARQFPSQEELNQQNGGNAMAAETVIVGGEETEEDYRKGKVLLQISSLYNFSEIHNLQKQIFGEEITFIGFPTTSKNGSAISPGIQLAISEKSGLKDAAWEFVKYFYTDDFQDELQWGWPTKLTSLEKKKEKDQKPETYTDENGKEVEYEPTYIVNGKEEKLGYVTDEECEKVMEFLKSVTQVMRYDEKVFNILTEEAGAYFAGQKPVEEVVKLIQNRVQTYLSEIQ